jgi:hypothetical protein
MCGDPMDVLLYINDMFQRITRGEFGEYEDLPYMFFMNWADKNHYVDHGTTIRIPFLTDKGKDLIESINKLK